MRINFIVIFMTLMLSPAVSYGGLIEFCTDLFNIKISQPEKFIQQFSSNSNTNKNLTDLLNRASDELKLTSEMAQALSEQGLLKDLGIKLEANNLSLKEGLIQEIENQILLKIKLTRNVDELINILNILKKYKQRSLIYSEKLLPSVFVKRRILGVYDIQQFYDGEITEKQLKEILKNKISASIPKITSVTQLTGMLRAMKRAGLDSLLPPGYLQSHPLVVSKMLDAKSIEQVSEKELRNVVFNQLQEYSNRANSFAEFFDLAEVLKDSDYTSKELRALLSPMTKLGEEFSNIPKLIDALETAIQKGTLNINTYNGGELVRSMELMNNDLSNIRRWELLENTESGFGFSLAIMKLAKSNGLSIYDASYLAKGGFARKHGLTEGVIKDILKRMKERKSFTILTAAEETIARRPEIGSIQKLMGLENYDESLKIISIKDQCDFGACWVHSPLEKYEIELSAQLGRPVELSTDYLYIQYLRDEYKRVLRENGSSYELVSEGGFSAAVPALVRKYGLVPKKYIPEGAISSSDIEGWDIQIFNKDSIAKIKKEMNEIFLAKTEKYHDYVKGISTSQFHIEAYDQRVDDLLNTYYRVPENETFRFRDSEFTSKSFTEKYFREILESDYEHVSLMHRKDDYTNPQKHKLGAVEEVSIEARFEDLKEINSIIKKSLSEGKAVQGSFYWPGDEGYASSAWVNKQNGTIIARRDLDKDPQFYKKMSKALDGHAVLIVGYEVNSVGEIIQYKTLNSWGKKVGDNGIFHMDQDFFKYFLKYIDVNRKTLLGHTPHQRRSIAKSAIAR